ncbi:MAG: asparaginyl/glutamyl-tRNA amidotransferase subunit C [Bacteroidetes bacterium RIFCSPHIGHO2_02_FULL_44_7]|nr:MAG: asparaginyl/glutamyl-tRNA amidotransferase subunit C [Bacteroidetes bacterium RIFCSPHIGHO2_02_FULL_44_7]
MKIDVEYVARLARIKLSQEETKLLTSHLGDILGYIDKLKELDAKDTPPTSHVLDIQNVFRKDINKPSLSAGGVLKCAPQKEGDYFKVPKVL